ncbi:MAG: cytochrome c3 family protein [bacterium]|nr:cytochrome c3 family protein [bacterium]
MITPGNHHRTRHEHSRRWIWLGPAALLAALMLFAIPQPMKAGIRGSAHDFSGLDPQQQICIFCHTAHNADMTVQEAPLWNHAVTTKIYTLYNSPTMNATTAQPEGLSRLCLSCHDGTVAVDSYGGRSGVIFLGGDVAIGADGLANDHPVAFTYDDALSTVDNGLFPPSSTPSGIGGTIQQDLLFDNQLECSSCHDVHNSGPAAAVNDNLLMITQVQSRLCLTCHNK